MMQLTSILNEDLEYLTLNIFKITISQEILAQDLNYLFNKPYDEGIFKVRNDQRLQHIQKDFNPYFLQEVTKLYT